MNQVGCKDARRRRAWLIALSSASLLLAAPAARAGDEFEDGFKDELGRLAAHEAVGVGRGILAGILLGGYYADYPDYPTHRPRYYSEREYPRWHYGRPYRRDYYRYHGYGWDRPRYHYHRHVHHHYHHGCDD